MELPPPTRYARRGELNIAYQAFGEGPNPMVLAPAVPSHLDLMWTEPVWARALRRGAALGRVVVYDPPGLGLSDPVDHVPTLEEQADDLRAVMDDAGIEHATLLASAFTTGGVVLFATQAPERVDALFLWSPFAQSFRTTPEEDLVGYGGRSKEIELAWADVLEHWGEGHSLGVYAPGLSSERLRRGWAMLERASASPAMIRAITEAETCADLTAILPLVEAPTVVVTHADAALPPGASRHVADLIPGAEFRLLPPSSEAAGFGDWFDSAIDEFVRLVTGRRHASGDPDRILATVLFTDIVDSTGHAARLGDREWRLVHDQHHALVRSHVVDAGGERINTSGDGTLSVLPGPARALRCAQSICRDVDALGIQVRAGVHTGECERTEDDLAGLAVHIGARVAAAAGPGEVWASRTVRDLVAGSGVDLRPRGVHVLKGVPEPWELFSLVKGGAAPVPVTARRPALRLSDRVVLAAARRAPRLLRAMNRG